MSNPNFEKSKTSNFQDSQNPDSGSNSGSDSALETPRKTIEIPPFRSDISIAENEAISTRAVDAGAKVLPKASAFGRIGNSTSDLGPDSISHSALRADLETSKSKAKNSDKPKAKTRGQRYALNKNKYLLDPEIERLEKILKAALENDESPRDALLLWLGLRTGARATELLGLRHADLNAYDETVFIRGIKGSNDRELPVESWFFQELLKYSETVARNTDLFDISYHRLRQIWDWYRPVPKKFHSLRHTFAIRLYRKTKDLRLVQVALGHRNITNTMVYADYVYSQQELKKLIL